MTGLHFSQRFLNDKNYRKRKEEELQLRRKRNSYKRRSIGGDVHAFEKEILSVVLAGAMIGGELVTGSGKITLFKQILNFYAKYFCKSH